MNAVGNLAVAPGPARAIALPEVGTAAPNTEEALWKPVDLELLLAGAHDEDWRHCQADQQRAAENARQLERDNLEKTLQQFLQPRSK